MKRRLHRGLLAALLLFPGILAAQRGPNPWWENPVASGLKNLTVEQRNRINAIVAEYRDRLVNERMEAEKAEHELDAIFNADLVDFSRGSAAIDRLVKARADVTRDVSEMTLRLRRVLTAEQWRTLQAQQPEDGRGRGPDGRGHRPDGQVGSPPPHPPH